MSGLHPSPPRGGRDEDHALRVALLDELEAFHRTALDDLASGEPERVFPVDVYGPRLSADFGGDHVRAAVNYLRSLVVTAHLGGDVVELPVGRGQRDVAHHMALSAPARWGPSWHGRQARRGYVGAVACASFTAARTLPRAVPGDPGFPRTEQLRGGLEKWSGVSVVEGLVTMLLRYRLTAAVMTSPSPRTTAWHRQVTAAVQRLTDAMEVLLASPDAATRGGAGRVGPVLHDLGARLNSLPGGPDGAALAECVDAVRSLAVRASSLSVSEDDA